MRRQPNGWGYIRAEHVHGGVETWYEDDTERVFYAPNDVGYEKWAALADEQARKSEAA